jgi:hypothetical protein
MAGSLIDMVVVDGFKLGNVALDYDKYLNFPHTQPNLLSHKEGI